MKKDGYAETTIKATGKRLRMIERHGVNLNDPEAVKEYIASKNTSNGYKEALCDAYDRHVKYNGLTWQRPRYQRDDQPPYVPTEEEIEILIANSGPKYALLLSLIRDTGMRPIEVERATVRWFDLERGLANVQTAKHGRGRTLELKPRTLAMLKEYIRRHRLGLNDRIFTTVKTMRRMLKEIKQRTAHKLQRPELLRISLYSLRHYFGTMTYYRTKDILYTQKKMGHRNLKNTLIYTHLVNFKSDEYTVRVAETIQEACKLVEAGFEYVTEMNRCKIFRKTPGNYTFLIVTDRIDLDDQIYKNFEKTGAITEPRIRARSTRHLKRLLKEDHRHVFTLIHKFKTEKEEEKFPVLSRRDDIIVICDEAHRTQYGTLALNMRTALPNASFIAFTATPLFVEDEKTRQIFGDYVSIYNFKQSVLDRATVPLYYINRKPEVEVVNKDLNPQIEKLIKEADLDEDEIEKLSKKYPNEFQIITEDSRLDVIAKDIVDHFMGRGYKGKAMVVCIDRFTAVKMYDKVQAFWKRRIKELEDKLREVDSQERIQLQKEIKYMKETDMAVVVSSSQNEIKKFKKKGLDIRPHRKRMVTEQLDAKFKDPDNPFRIVFVCAMWMTGFDAPPVSTIYLDKPIRNHTLMQTISRANRVFEDKQSGMIVDYYGILRKLNEALAIYGSGTGGGIQEGDTPLRQANELADLLEKNLKLMEKYFEDKEIEPQKILLAKDFEQLKLIEQAVEAILENDESKVLFFSLLKLVVNSYTDLLPDPKANEYKPLVSLYVVIGETIASDIPDIDISDVEKRIQDLIDRSIAVKPYAPRKPTKPIDLSKIDLTQIQISYKKGRKRTEAEKLRSIINRKLTELLRKNKYRIDFQERLEKIVNDYNMGTINIEQYFQRLTKLINDLQEEEKRHIKEGLTEEELAIFDILIKPKPKLTRKKEQQIKDIAKELLEKLKEQKFVLDWKKKTRTRADVQVTIETILWDRLPEPPYTPEIKKEKCILVYQHVYDSYHGAGQSVYT